MIVQKYITTITGIDELNNHVKMFRLAFQHGKLFHFTAGQFVILTITGVDGKSQRRSYSIASSPRHADYIELCIKILDNGKVSGMLDELSIGTQLEIDGPYGKFIVDKDKEEKKELIFVAAGVGIAPVRGIIFDLFEKGCTNLVWLFFGFRYEDNFLFKDDFRQLEAQYNNFHFVPVLSRPGQNPSSELDKGHVTDIIPLYIKDPKDKTVFICGSLPMVRDVVAILEKIGITKEQIKTDAWG